MQSAHIFISGSVQGIGYRQFVKKLAKKKELMGWVRNLPDGRVEVLLQGNINQIKEMIVHLEKGPFMASVKEVIVAYEESPKIYSEFLVLSTKTS